MNRRSLLDGNMTPARERDDVFGDEFEAEEDYNIVADGWRPGHASRTSEDESQSRGLPVHDGPVRTISAHHAHRSISPRISPGLLRNSIQKSRRGENPFASPDDDETTPLDRRQSLQFEPDDLTAQRSASSASSRIYPQTQSPRFSSAGPSHPYALYPQGTIPRTPSVATSSTTRPPRRSLSQRGPQHPYAMYPQGVDEDLDDDDDEDEDAVQQNPVHVGFPGLGSNYLRRVGPDGEEQDIIGDYGHAEQLPPYSRYPDEAPEKMPLLMPTALHSRAPVAGTDPTMDLMHTPLRPSAAPQSMMDESTLNRTSSVPSLTRVRSASESVSINVNKDWKEKTWREKRRTRFCGIPMWWYMIAVGLIVFILAVLAGVVGGFIAGKHGSSTSNALSTPIDASIIASPTIAGPPTGTFALSLGTPTQTQASCLPQQDQQGAWDCDLVPNQALAINVGLTISGNRSGANIYYASSDRRIFYGSQAWSMNTAFDQFLAVSDNDDPAKGVAWYFEQFYDKIVVLPENAINATTKKIKRDAFWHNMVSPDKQLFNQPNAGEKPWFCVWNGTFLEGFIYMQAPLPNTSISSPPTSAPSTASATATRGSAITATPTNFGRPFTSTFPNQYTTATVTGIQSAADAAGSSASSFVEHGKDADGSSSRRKRDDDDDDDDDNSAWSRLLPYPYVVKLEERRLANNPIQPYCQQYQILWDLNANWVSDTNGDPIIVQLDESDPADVDQARKRDGAGECHCQWVSGEV